MSTPATRPDTTRLQRLAHSYRDSAALMAAVELGLFTRVVRGAETEAAVAQALDLTPTNAERLVTACVALGLLVREGDRLHNAPDVARFLVEGEPTYAGPWMLFSGPRDPALWGLAEALWGSTGVAHSVAECRAYVARAGARDVAVHEFVAGVLTRVTGRRPG